MPARDLKTVSKPVEGLTFPEMQDRYKATMASQALRVAHIIAETPDVLLVTGADKIEKLDKIARKALNLETAQPLLVVNVALLSTGKPELARNLPASLPATTETPTGLKPATAREVPALPES